MGFEGQNGRRISGVGVKEIVGTGLSIEEAEAFHEVLEGAISRAGGGGSGSDPRDIWREISAQGLLKPCHPHSLHQLVYYSVYAAAAAAAELDVSTGGGLPFYWFPSLCEYSHWDILEESGLYPREVWETERVLVRDSVGSPSAAREGRLLIWGGYGISERVYSVQAVRESLSSADSKGKEEEQWKGETGTR